jgi:hypothetical protein
LFAAFSLFATIVAVMLTFTLAFPGATTTATVPMGQQSLHYLLGFLTRNGDSVRAVVLNDFDTHYILRHILTSFTYIYMYRVIDI